MEIKKIGFIGAGKMGGAIIKSIVSSGFVSSSDVIIFEPNQQIAEQFKKDLNVNIAENNVELAKQADMIVLCTKPYLVGNVLKEIRKAINPETLILSIAAGITTFSVEEILGSENPVIRAIPNTPILVNQGMCAISSGKYATSEHMHYVSEMFNSSGKCIQTEEKLINVITAITSSGPAFMYSLIDAISEGGVKLGLQKHVALELAAQTALGAAEMILESGKHPSALKDEVTTPGGCTIEGIATMEKHAVRYALIETIENTYKKLI